MREPIQVVYENGVLRPLDALPSHFQEHQRLTVTLEEVADATGWLADADPSVSLEAVRRALGKTANTMAELVNAERQERCSSRHFNSDLASSSWIRYWPGWSGQARLRLLTFIWRAAASWPTSPPASGNLCRSRRPSSIMPNNCS